MKYINSDMTLSDISAKDIARYLGMKGWKRRTDFPNKKLFVFDRILHQNNENLNIVIPSSEDFDDFYPKLKDVIHTLNITENRSLNEIIQDITKPNVDKLQVRVISDIASEGSIPLSYASNLIQGLRDLIISAACAEERPEPFYKRATKIATNYADAVRFGQTQKGSFIATIESSVQIPSNYKQLSLIDGDMEQQQIPFSRRVMQRIQIGISQIEEAVLNGSFDEVIKNGYKTGLNANMCEALMSLKTESSDMKFEYHMNWAPILPAPKNIPNKITIERNGFEFLESIARSFRGSDESTKKEIVGYIVALNADEIDDEDSEEESNRVVTIRWDNIGKKQNVKVVLGVEEYKQACDAHRDGKKVFVQGMLERYGKQWHLMAPEDFRIITE